MLTGRTVAAVVVAGLIGAVANNVFVAVIMQVSGLGLDLALQLAQRPGRYAIAIAVAALLPLLARLSGPLAWAAALVLLTVIPTLLAKLVFTPDAPLIWALAANLVYAGAAVATYALIARRRP
jgi:hypothetical protein